MSITYAAYDNVLRDNTGRAVVNAEIFVYRADTGVLAQLYDLAGNPVGQPLSTDQHGGIDNGSTHSAEARQGFRAPGGRYLIRSFKNGVEGRRIPEVMMGTAQAYDAEDLISATGNIYASVADGLAATDEGGFFWVTTGEAEGELLTLYRNNAGSAQEIGNLATSELVRQLAEQAEQAVEEARYYRDQTATFGGYYADTAAGLAGTTDSQIFSVANDPDPGKITVYRNNAGTADVVMTYVPATGTAAGYDVGTSPGHVPLLGDDGAGGPSYPPADASQLKNLPVMNVPVRSVLGSVRASFGSNAVAFTCQAIESYSGSQYTVYWRTGDEKLVVAKRALPAGSWQLYVFDGQSGRPDIALASRDSHWVCSLGIDDAGRVIICYNTRNNSIKWRYSAPEDITAWSTEQQGMTGQNESSATYPTFMYGPNRKLLFAYRQGESGNGNLMVNVWDSGSLTWSALHHPLVSGTDTSPMTTPYWWNAPITADGSLHLFWCWRESGGVETNFDICYARSVDGGVTWTRSDGTPYTLPITQGTAEVAEAIPQGSNLLNQGNAAVDSDGNPLVVYQRNDANGIPQTYLARRASGGWSVEQVSSRSRGYDLSGLGSRYLPQARPGVVVYPRNRIVVIARDWEYGGGLMFYASQRGKWVQWGPVSDNLNGWEPQWDRRRFLDEGVLDLMVAAVSDLGTEPTWNYETPLEVWSFPTLESIPTAPTKQIEVVATMGRWGEELTTTSTTLVDTPAAFAFSRAAYPRYPNMARWIARVENTAGGSSPAAIALCIKRQDKGHADAQGPLPEAEFALRWAPDADRVIIDSGWRQIPLIDGSFPDVGFINVRLAAPQGGTVRVTAFTLMLGAATAAKTS